MHTLTVEKKLASVCCLALRDIDEQLYSRILLLLSTDSPISDNLAQEAALKATTILVRRYNPLVTRFKIKSHSFQLPGNCA